ncbi:uncharacterized protein ACA1_300040 [Acanthamoeba castellanii str. Neff]|uniref:Uncharacterized protein n=1 Tax=Acanthamoeba castellanii (strain ATCC 30010 / Neff) TaxID=1257118 RepID=L8HBT9_ACACF|nr:uncharacterized protein ACA1_300040 [Acanthamoeba castellanii str. Neff]ELR22707.1 hypothetical protein ACA1_300040 [Acanthamoeba castellanii str. Neff]
MAPSAVGDVFNFSAGNGFVYNIRSINVFPLSAGRKRAAGETVHVNGSPRTLPVVHPLHPAFFAKPHDWAAELKPAPAPFLSSDLRLEPATDKDSTTPSLPAVESATWEKKEDEMCAKEEEQRLERFLKSSASTEVEGAVRPIFFACAGLVDSQSSAWAVLDVAARLADKMRQPPLPGSLARPCSSLALDAAAATTASDLGDHHDQQQQPGDDDDDEEVGWEEEEEAAADRVRRERWMLWAGDLAAGAASGLVLYWLPQGDRKGLALYGLTRSGEFLARFLPQRHLDHAPRLPPHQLGLLSAAPTWSSLRSSQQHGLHHCHRGSLVLNSGGSHVW